MKYTLTILYLDGHWTRFDKGSMWDQLMIHIEHHISQLERENIAEIRIEAFAEDDNNAPGMVS